MAIKKTINALAKKLDQGAKYLLKAFETMDDTFSSFYRNIWIYFPKFFFKHIKNNAALGWGFFGVNIVAGIISAGIEYWKDRKNAKLASLDYLFQKLVQIREELNLDKPSSLKTDDIPTLNLLDLLDIYAQEGPVARENSTESSEEDGPLLQTPSTKYINQNVIVQKLNLELNELAVELGIRAFQFEANADSTKKTGEKRRSELKDYTLKATRRELVTPQGLNIVDNVKAMAEDYSAITWIGWIQRAMANFSVPNTGGDAKITHSTFLGLPILRWVIRAFIEITEEKTIDQRYAEDREESDKKILLNALYLKHYYAELATKVDTQYSAKFKVERAAVLAPTDELPDFVKRLEADRTSRVVRSTISSFMSAYIGIYFVSWPISMLAIAFGASATIFTGPIGVAVVIGLAVACGIGYAIRAGIKARKANDEEKEKIVNKAGILEQIKAYEIENNRLKNEFNETYKNISDEDKARYAPEFAEGSLTENDRWIRRKERKQGGATRFINKLGNRANTFIGRFWTGSLSVRSLLQSGSLLPVVGVGVASIVFFGIGLFVGLAFASFKVWQYHQDSKHKSDANLLANTENILYGLKEENKILQQQKASIEHLDELDDSATAMLVGNEEHPIEKPIVDLDSDVSYSSSSSSSSLNFSETDPLLGAPVEEVCPIEQYEGSNRKIMEKINNSCSVPSFIPETKSVTVQDEVFAGKKEEAGASAIEVLNPENKKGTMETVNNIYLTQSLAKGLKLACPDKNQISNLMQTKFADESVNVQRHVASPAA